MANWPYDLVDKAEGSLCVPRYNQQPSLRTRRWPCSCGVLHRAVCPEAVTAHVYICKPSGLTHGTKLSCLSHGEIAKSWGRWQNGMRDRDSCNKRRHRNGHEVLSLRQILSRKQEPAGIIFRTLQRALVSSAKEKLHQGLPQTTVCVSPTNRRDVLPLPDPAIPSTISRFHIAATILSHKSHKHCWMNVQYERLPTSAKPTNDHPLARIFQRIVNSACCLANDALTSNNRHNNCCTLSYSKCQ